MQNNDDYIGLTCPFCQSVLKPGQDVVKCAQCGTFHHKECWQEYTACSMCGCKRNITLSNNFVSEQLHPGKGRHVWAVAIIIVIISIMAYLLLNISYITGEGRKKLWELNEKFHIITKNKNEKKWKLQVSEMRKEAEKARKNVSCGEIKSKQIRQIKGIKQDKVGNIIVTTINGEKITLKKNNLDTIIDDKGNQVYVTEITYNGIEFIFEGKKGFEATLNFDENKQGNKIIIMDGEGKISGKIGEQSIKGNNFAGKFILSFGENFGDFEINAEKARAEIGKDFYLGDFYSGQFKTKYEKDELTEFTLNNGARAMIRGHLRIWNRNDRPLKMITQKHKDSSKIIGVWHNSVNLAMYNEERVNVNKLGNDEIKKYISNTIITNKNKIKQLEKQLIELDNSGNNYKTKELGIKNNIKELKKYNENLKKIRTKENLITTIGKSITELEKANYNIWNEFPNIGYLEYDINANNLYRIDRASRIIPSGIVILEGETSYGINFGNGNTEPVSLEGLQNGVYSIYSPREYDRDIGKLNKRGFFYFQAGEEDLVGDYGVVRIKNYDHRVSEIKTGKYFDGNTYVKVKRTGVAKDGQKYLRDSEFNVIIPNSKEIRTSIIRLDKDGFYYIFNIEDVEKANITINPKEIKKKTEKYKKIRKFALDSLDTMGLNTNELERHVMREENFLEDYKQAEKYIREKKLSK